MNTIDIESIYGCDVDGTLISLRRYKEGTPGTIMIMNPYLNEPRYVKVHEAHVELVREMLGRGRVVLVWSGSGVKWVRAVLDALNLNHKNLFSLTKPVGYIDDLPCERWLNNRIFIPYPELENEELENE